MQKRIFCYTIILLIAFFNRLSLLVLINDQYGNYVIQRLFEYSDKAIRRVIYDTIMSKEHFEEARKTGFGKSL